MVTNAWHLRSDGKAFPVQVHLYAMNDPDLSSEAEVSAFIIKTNSKDQDLAEYVIDGFMALLLENAPVSRIKDAETIEATLRDKLSHLPFKFAYPLTIDEMLEIHRNQNNFNDFESAVSFIDEVAENIGSIQKKIKDSFNQQFCRVRFGGQLSTSRGNKSLWFRISSVGYNWDNTIYGFAAEIAPQYGVRYITICRDSESDGVEDDNFYKAKDGTVYYMMSIDEFFDESHEKNPVFSATELGAGVIQSIRKELSKGNTILGAYDLLEKEGITCTRDYRPYLLRKEIEDSYISASIWFEELGTRTKLKISKMVAIIKRKFPEILDIDVDFNERENNKGNMVGFELLCTLVSDHPKIDNMVINIASTKPLSAMPADGLVRMFTNEYSDFIKFSKIQI